MKRILFQAIILMAVLPVTAIEWNDQTKERYPWAGFLFRGHESESPGLENVRVKLDIKLEQMSQKQVKEESRKRWRTAEQQPSLVNLYSASYVELFGVSRFSNSGFAKEMKSASRLRFLSTQKDHKVLEYDLVRTCLFGFIENVFISKIDQMFELRPTNRHIRALFKERNQYFGAPKHDLAFKVSLEDYRKNPNLYINVRPFASWHTFHYVDNKKAPKSIGLRALELLEEAAKVRPSGSSRASFDKLKEDVRRAMKKRGHL
jgi:hypothetical protein